MAESIGFAEKSLTTTKSVTSSHAPNSRQPREGNPTSLSLPAKFYHARMMKYNLIFMLAFGAIAIFYDKSPNLSLFCMFTAGVHFGCFMMKFGSDEFRKKIENDFR